MIEVNKKKIKNYALAFIIPIVMFLIISILTNHVPFGKYLFNYIDSYKMYPSLLVNTIRSLKEGQFFYNLHSAFGTDFYNMRSLYMNSPLNLLFLFFKEDQLILFYTLLIFFRMGLSGLTMCIFLNSISKEKYTWKQILFSLMYALSSYGVAYSVQIMWMDSFILLPLIILGLNKLIMEKNSKLYVLFLTITIFINFYIGFMVCIFCLIYFIYKSYIEKKFNFDNIKRFILSSLLCGLMCSVIIIPQLFSLLAGRGKAFEFSKLLGISNYSLFTIPISLTSGSYLYIDNFSNGSPLIYCSLLVLAMVILYFFNKKINKREKKGTFVVLLFFFLSLFINIIDFSWNMFQEPVWWAHRYAFVIVFFMIMIGFISFERIKDVEMSKKSQIISLCLVIILIVLGFVFKSFNFISPKYYIVGVIASLIIFVLYFNLWNNKSYKYIVIVCVLCELLYNGFTIIKENSQVTIDDYKVFMARKNDVSRLKEIDDSFYRVILSDSHPDDSMMFNVYTGDLFGSSYDGNFRDFLINKLNTNLDASNMIFMIRYNPAILSLLGIKYEIGNSDYYTYIDENIYKNDTSLGIGVVIPNNFKEPDLINDDGFNNINKIYSSIIGTDVDMFDEVEIENYEYKEELDEFDNIISKASYSFIAENDGVFLPKNIYLFYRYINIKVNDEVIIYSNRDHFDEIVKIKKGDKVEVKYTADKKILGMVDYDFKYDSLSSAVMREDKFLEAINKIKEYSQLYDISTDKHVISGKINSDGGILFISIPYNDSFTIKVDGKKVDYNKIFDSFIGVNVEEGEHEITIDYIPKGFIVGIIISVISIFLTLIYLKIDKQKR